MPLQFSLVLSALLVIGCSSQHQQAEATKFAANADDAIASIRAILPPGWTICEIARDTYPHYRTEGKGVGVFLAPPEAHQLKDKPEGIVYLMPPSYRDPGGDPTHGLAQTWPPALIGQNARMKVYLWCGWDGAREQLVNALNLKPVD